MEGEIFKVFVETKKLNKTKLAADLKMSKQNLYQLFESKVLQPETIGKIERKFRVKWEKIKEQVNIDVSRVTPTFKKASKGDDNNTSLLPVLVELVKTQNRILQDQKDELIETVKRMETNLNFVAGKAEALEHDLVSSRTVTLRSLARIEGLEDADQLLNEADMIKISQVAAKDESYRKVGTGKMNR